MGSSNLCRKEYVDAKDQRNNLKQPNCLIWTLPYKLQFVILELLLCTGSLPTSAHWSHWRKTEGLQEERRTWSFPLMPCLLHAFVILVLPSVGSRQQLNTLWSFPNTPSLWPLTETNSRQLNSPNSLGLSPNPMGPSSKLSHTSPGQVVSFPWQFDFQLCRSPLSRF